MRLVLLFILLTLNCMAFSQSDSTVLPYKRFPSVPPLQLLLSDSTTLFTKSDLPDKTPVLLMVFSPDCNHCQKEAEELYQLRDELKGTRIVMATMHTIASMKNFITSYKLDELQNVVVGKDIYYLLPSFYGFHNLPFHAMYNKKGRLLGVFEGSARISNMLKELKD